MTHKFKTAALIKMRGDSLWTQEDLAAASGVSVRTIQRIEKGGRPSVETWKALAAAFDIPSDKFLVSPEEIMERLGEDETAIKRAAIGVTVGCAGGLFGCSFAWWAILENPTAYSPFMTAYIGVATTALFILPIWYWKQALRAK